MSGRLIGKVYALQLGRAEQAIAVALAEHGRDDGSGIFPGNAYLAWKTGYSERHIVRLLRELQGLGLLIPVGRPGGGRGHVQQYRMEVNNVPRKQPFRAPNPGMASCYDDDESWLETVSNDALDGSLTVTSETAKGDIGAVKGDIDEIAYKDAGAFVTVQEPSRGTVGTAREALPDTSMGENGTRGGDRTFPSDFVCEDLAQARRPRGGGMKYQGAMFDAVCATCCRDPNVITWRARQETLAAAGRLERAGYTPDDVAYFGQHWFGAHAPTPRQVQDSIEAVLAVREKCVKEKSNGTTHYRNRAHQRDADDFEIERVIRAAVLGEGVVSEGVVSEGVVFIEPARSLNDPAHDAGGDGMADDRERFAQGVSDLGDGEDFAVGDHRYGPRLGAPAGRRAA